MPLLDPAPGEYCGAVDAHLGHAERMRPLTFDALYDHDIERRAIPDVAQAPVLLLVIPFEDKSWAPGQPRRLEVADPIVDEHDDRNDERDSGDRGAKGHP